MDPDSRSATAAGLASIMLSGRGELHTLVQQFLRAHAGVRRPDFEAILKHG